MKLDPTDLRYLSGDEFRVLTAVEMGSKNHEVVPTPLIAQISGLRTGGVNKCIGELAKRNLIARVVGIKYDGYRLTYGGYDFLAMRSFAKRDSFYSVGNQIGTGKESDIYVVGTEDGEQLCLKIHRLGRISFRTIKSKRDYLRKGQSASWMYMSRLSAMKEYAFMQVLHEHGFPVPKPVDQARHCIVMELMDAFPLRQISEIANPGALYSDLMDLIVRLARSGLIHGDFNEFNILVREPKEGEDETTAPAIPILIDFPQMVSTDHENAEYYFNRDVQCIRTFFKKRFRYESTVYPRFSATVKDGKKDFELDVMVAASGFGKKEGEELERYMKMLQEAEDHEDGEQDEGDEDEEGDDHDADVQEGEDPVASTSSTQAAEVGVEDEANQASESDEEDDIESDQESQEEEEEEEEEDEEVDRAARRAAKRAAGAREQAQASSQRLALKEQKDVRAIVSSNLEKQQASRERKHHGRKGPIAGRAKGSKRKTDPRTTIKDSVQF